MINSKPFVAVFDNHGTLRWVLQDIDDDSFLCLLTHYVEVGIDWRMKTPVWQKNSSKYSKENARFVWLNKDEWTSKDKDGLEGAAGEFKLQRFKSFEDFMVSYPDIGYPLFIQAL